MFSNASTLASQLVSIAIPGVPRADGLAEEGAYWFPNVPCTCHLGSAGLQLLLCDAPSQGVAAGLMSGRAVGPSKLYAAFARNLNMMPPPLVNLPVLKLFTKAGDTLPWPSVRVDSDAVVGQTRSRRMQQVACALVCTGMVLGFTLGSLAGEKIRITQSTNQMDLPQDPDKSFIAPGAELFRSKISPGEGSQGPIVPPPGQPNLMRNPRFEELMDRKRNWIYESPNDRDKAIEEIILGGRKYEMEDLHKRPKTLMERQFEGSTGQENRTNPRANRQGKDGTADDRLSGQGEFDRMGRFRGSEGSGQDRGIIPELNPAYLFNPTMAPDPFTQIEGGLGRNSILPPGLGDPNFGRKLPTQSVPQPTQLQRDVNGFWDYRKSPVGRLSDPINDPVDATRTMMNPIAARKPSVPAPESVQTTMPGSFSPSSTRPDIFSPTQNRPPGAGGYTVPVATPASAPVFQPRPAVLEIPRPKF
jgi:hypothetical protein